mgnify:CR=1 FL=1
MTIRTRFIYSKRGGACFVPHIALAQLFSRSAVRAGLKLAMTQGFSPRAKISFGPELPAGVVALNEPVDMYFDDEGLSTNIQTLMNSSLPEGFKISRVIFPDDNSPAIGKLCTHAEYLARIGLNLSEYAREFFGTEIIFHEEIDNWLRFIILAPAQHPIGGFVKFLINQKVINGWHEINIVRSNIGQFDGEKVYLS